MAALPAAPPAPVQPAVMILPKGLTGDLKQWVIDKIAHDHIAKGGTFSCDDAQLNTLKASITSQQSVKFP